MVRLPFAFRKFSKVFAVCAIAWAVLACGGEQGSSCSGLDQAVLFMVFSFFVACTLITRFQSLLTLGARVRKIWCGRAVVQVQCYVARSLTRSV